MQITATAMRGGGIERKDKTMRERERETVDTYGKGECVDTNPPPIRE